MSGKEGGAGFSENLTHFSMNKLIAEREKHAGNSKQYKTL